MIDLVFDNSTNDDLIFDNSTNDLYDPQLGEITSHYENGDYVEAFSKAPSSNLIS